jgi:hypothetical protein
MSTATQEKPSRPVRRAVFIGCAVAAAGVAAILIFVGGVLFAVFGVMRNSEVCTIALDRANHDPELVAVLGEPIGAGWFVSGKVETAGPSGTAELSVPISGPRGKGTLYIVAKKTADRWEYTVLEVAIPGRTERINLVASPRVRRGDSLRAEPRFAPHPDLQLAR